MICSLLKSGTRAGPGIGYFPQLDLYERLSDLGQAERGVGEFLET